MSYENWSDLCKFLYTFRSLRWAWIFILSWYLAWDIELEILSAKCSLDLIYHSLILCLWESAPLNSSCKVGGDNVLNGALGPSVPPLPMLSEGAFSSPPPSSGRAFPLMASFSSFLLFFSRVLGERAHVVALSSLFLFFFVALAFVAFLASSSLYASPVVSPACNAWPNCQGCQPFKCPSINYRQLWSSQVISNHLPQPFLIVVTSSRDLESPPLVPAIAIRNLLFATSFPSTILKQIWEWIQIHSLVLKDFRQFRACDVIRITTCDTLFLAKESRFQKWLTDAFPRAVQCC